MSALLCKCALNGCELCLMAAEGSEPDEPCLFCFWIAQPKEER